ncbi:MAG TPA: HEPN domain-containing protein, partial [Polyangiaceae bacterium]
DKEIGIAAGEVAAVQVATGLPLAPLPMSTEQLEALRRAERALARDIDDEGDFAVTEDNRRRAIAHELRHADQAWSASRALHELGLSNDALSRLYHAIFHVMAALLLSAGVEVRRHRALPGLLGTHFAGSLLSGGVR